MNNETILAAYKLSTTHERKYASELGRCLDKEGIKRNGCRPKSVFAKDKKEFPNEFYECEYCFDCYVLLAEHILKKVWCPVCLNIFTLKKILLVINIMAAYILIQT